MRIVVKCFAGLRERFGAETALELPPGARAADAWRALAGPGAPPPGVFCAVNLEHADFDRALAEGDEVAFFPRISGG